MTDIPGEGDLGRAAARGGVWSVAGEVSSRVSQIVVFFALAGVLSPAEFGLAAIAFFCVQIVNSLTYAGLGQAVQVLGPDEQRDRTAVGMGLVFGFAGAGVLALLAGPLCHALGAPGAVPLVRFVGLAVPLGQSAEVLAALLARDLRFRTTATAVIAGAVGSAAAGLTLAATGVGPMALVVQTVLQHAIRLLWLIAARPSGFRPLLVVAKVREILRIGRELLLSSLFETSAANIDNVLVSALSGAAALGAYGFGYNLAALPMYVVGIAVSRVALPVYARMSARPWSIGPAFQQAIEITTWLTALPLGYFAIAGPAALHVLFGNKWSAIDEALRLLALHGWLRATETASTTVLVAVGQAATTRRVQQWQLLLAAALLVPLVSWDGPFGAALAIVVAVTVGTTYSLTQSTRWTGASRPAILARLLEGAAAGVAGGETGLLVLRHVTGLGGLALSLTTAALTWLACLAVLRQPTVRLAIRVLRT
ncbi:MAG: polysaccharide biosynthesis protein [Frankiales bacterium]|nr:polysaccharide biosynthesis protein [Frankiales bacterium]